MALNSFDRNYGASLNSRELFFGNNGWLTIVIDMPGTAEFGETAVADDSSDAYITAKSAAEYNQFKVVQLLAQRGVITATSAIAETAGAVTFSGNNVLNVNASGTPAAADTAMSFLMERADVFTAQASKPGAVNPTAYAVDPLADIATIIKAAEFFKEADGTAAGVTADLTIAVLDALSPILA